MLRGLASVVLLYIVSRRGGAYLRLQSQPQYAKCLKTLGRNLLKGVVYVLRKGKPMTAPEITAMQRRITELDGEVRGEKQVTRHLLEQLSQNTEILLELRREITTMHQKLSKVSDAIAIQGAQLTALEPRLSGIVADSMRAVMRERRED